MKNLSDNTLGNPICKMPASKIEMSVKRAKYSLVIGTTLLAGLLPFPANAQLSEETLNIVSGQNGIDQLQLFPPDGTPNGGIISLSQERLNLLSEQERIVQQQLSTPDEGVDTSLIERGENYLVKPVFCLDFASSDSFASKKSCGGVTFFPTAIDTYSVVNRIDPPKCTSYVENYGCYAIEWQRGQNSNQATAFGPWVPTASALNAQENNTTFFPGGNPPGGWAETLHAPPSINNKAFNEFAVGAAKVMNDWKTPVFFDVNFGSGNNAIAVLESITFNIYDSLFNTNTLSSLCSSYGFNENQANARNVASNCERDYGEQNPGFDVASIDIAYWRPTGRVDESYSGSTLSNFILTNFNNRASRIYVWDPPETIETAEKVPEPSSVLGLLAFGLFSVGSFFGRKRKYENKNLI